uniref:Uncharacterized protein n=1 Tax=Plasmid pSC101 TaxID=2625 RepID=Q51953_9ZZZZ|nr:unknown protein [Plasmid pSC101]
MALQAPFMDSCKETTHNTRKARHGLLRAFYGGSAMWCYLTFCCSAVPAL